uniref:Uncharacterized protein n=1 Tax=Theileria annulata TaxID=5874 RepID=A0A3B0MEX9_THEAN
MLLGNIMEQVYNHTQDTATGVHANNLKNAYTQLKDKATALHGAANALGDAADGLKNAIGASDETAGTDTLRQALKQLDDDPSGTTATKVFEKFNAVVTAYNGLTDKGSLETQFTDLQTEYSNAIYVYKKYFLTWPSIATNWLNFLTFVIFLIVHAPG